MSASRVTGPNDHHMDLNSLRYRNCSGHSEMEMEEGSSSPYQGHHQYNNYYGTGCIIKKFHLDLKSEYLDTEELERHRLERKRERNRIAATKCRFYFIFCSRGL